MSIIAFICFLTCTPTMSKQKYTLPGEALRCALCPDSREEEAALLPKSIPITSAAETKESPTQNVEGKEEEEEEGRRLAHLSMAQNKKCACAYCVCGKCLIKLM